MIMYEVSAISVLDKLCRKPVYRKEYEGLGNTKFCLAVSFHEGRRAYASAVAVPPPSKQRDIFGFSCNPTL
jgi:hypothetical protein